MGLHPDRLDLQRAVADHPGREAAHALGGERLLLLRARRRLGLRVREDRDLTYDSRWSSGIPGVGTFKGVSVEQDYRSTWYGTTYITATYTMSLGKDITHNHSVEADRAIDIQFIGRNAGASPERGKSEGKVTVESKGSGGVTVLGRIDNPTGVTKVTSGKAIETFGDEAFIGGRRVELEAKTGIGSSALQPLVTSVTDADTKFGKRVLGNGQEPADYLYTGIGGLDAETLTGAIHVQERTGQGDLPIDQVLAKSGGDVVVTTPGSITVGKETAGTHYAGRVQGGNVTLVAAGEITLPLLPGQTTELTTVSDSAGRYFLKQSGAGGIGNSAAVPLVIDSGAFGVVDAKVNAIAGGDVFLREEAGDLRVETISTGDEVFVEVPGGNLLDANTTETRDERTYEELKGGVWTDLSLTRDLGALDKIEAARVTLRSLKEFEYQTYWSYRNQQPDPSQYDPGFQVQLTQAERDFYEELYGPDQDDIDQGIATLEAARTTQYHALHLAYGAYGDSFIASETSEAASVDGATDEILLTADHSYANGEKIVYRNVGNASIAIQGGGKLLDGSVYYVIDAAANRIKLATSAANATNGMAIDLADQTLATEKGSHTLRTGFIYELTAAEEATLTAGFKIWTEEELLYSISAGLLKEVSDTTVNIEDPNITGARVTLNVQGRIGTPSGTTDIDVTTLRVPPTTGNMTLAGNTVTLASGTWNAPTPPASRSSSRAARWATAARGSSAECPATR
jgi:hypothetical protein